MRTAPTSRRSPNFRRVQSSTAAFGLIEVVSALAIATFCLVGLIGLLSVGIKSDSDSTSELGAANIAQSLLATRRAMPEADLRSSDFPLPKFIAGTSVPEQLVFVDANGAEVQNGRDKAARYALVYRVEAPSTGTLHRIHLAMFWPAGAFASTSNLQNAKANATGLYEQVAYMSLE